MQKITYIFYLIIFICTSSYLSGENVLRERVYLQTDKNVYLAGEMAWLKFYTTDISGYPLSESQVGYVELLDSNNPQIQIKVNLHEGVGEGWMELSPELSTGNYKLVAYTRNMKNEGESIYFSKTISLINTFITEKDVVVYTDTLVQTDAGITDTTLASGISIKPTQTNYTNRAKGNILLDRLPENIHSLAISISGKDLPTGIKNKTMAEWNELNKSQKLPLYESKFLPEYEGHIISGKVINIETSEDVKGETIDCFLASPGSEILLFKGQTGQDSNVEFFTDRVYGTQEVLTTIPNPEQSKYRVNILSPFTSHTYKDLPSLKINTFWKDQLTQRSVEVQALHVFAGDSINQLDNPDSYFRYKPDVSYLLDEYTRFTTIEEIVIEFMQGIRFRKINNKQTIGIINEQKTNFIHHNILAMIDGIPIWDHEIIYNYNPLLLKRADVFYGKYIFGGQMFEGIAAFWSYDGNYPGLKPDEVTQFFDYEGVQPKRYFYTPTYEDEKSRKSRKADFRHTLLWDSDVKINGNSSVAIPFTTSDLIGDFQVTVEGLTTDGKIIYGTTTFEVE